MRLLDMKLGDESGQSDFDHYPAQSERRLERLHRWQSARSKLAGSSQRSKACPRTGHSLSRIENQQVLRLRRL
jgi:hypothetical protein